ncbi:hypothetical protein [Burkholderia cenocepacia]|uniref:hypothetical protein n=1 Tax=Burkholderia cenocepacia TaxID=95486 RepID=UPI001B9A3012|nr:hypothetical protein [Burkholderia cenocepacia]MBR7905930.1 hypothetical protein [Burkholderia cenocepacia]MBR8424016.1 hypothetical protein [Burkholderia cenocepacia]
MPNDNVLSDRTRSALASCAATYRINGCRSIADEIDALLAAHPGRPEPRAEVTALIAAAEKVVSADRACALDDSDINALANAVDAARAGGA